jgi:hypothetical protein
MNSASKNINDKALEKRTLLSDPEVQSEFNSTVELPGKGQIRIAEPDENRSAVNQKTSLV